VSDTDTGAAPEGVSFDELRLAARNHGMPLEALGYDLTPIGLHYLLIHFDIPAIDPAAWRLRIDGLVERPVELSLADLRARPRETVAVTLILGQTIKASPRILENGGATISGFIALRAGGDDFTVSGLMAAGAVLFILTLGTNMGASLIIARSPRSQCRCRWW